MLESTHVPNPLHACPVCHPSVQEVLPHGVPCGCSAHAPDPSHSPELPQVEGSSNVHSLWGSLPNAMGPHTPSRPADLSEALQAMQGPVQAVSQQNPSTQLPLAHCAPFRQGEPLA